ncbi:MAG: hypothetical protein KF767_17705 [Bdellovibrionaceae bacterium]|nr:hypothetical protein [Pseudobdellovibrionaceae bacterium]
MEVDRHAFRRQFSLRLGHVDKGSDHRLTHSGLSIKVIFDRKNPRSDLLQAIRERQVIQKVTAKAEVVGNEDHVDLPAVNISHEPLVRWADRNCGVAVILVDFNDLTESTITSVSVFDLAHNSVLLSLKRSFRTERLLVG